MPLFRRTCRAGQGVHPGATAQLGCLRVRVLSVPCSLPTQIHLFMCFNVATGSLNELQFVIFMVNLESRSCWLILLVGGKTRVPAAVALFLIGILCDMTAPDRTKGAPDVQAPRLGRSHGPQSPIPVRPIPK